MKLPTLPTPPGLKLHEHPRCKEETLGVTIPMIGTCQACPSSWLMLGYLLPPFLYPSLGSAHTSLSDVVR